ISFNYSSLASNPGTWTGLGGRTLDSTTQNFALNASSDPLLLDSLTDVQSAGNVLGVSFGDTYSSSGTAVAVAQTNLTVAAGGISSSKPIVFTNNSLNYTINSADSIGITGSTSVSLVGTGTVTFTGPNTYSGGTTISAGTLQLGDGSPGHDGSLAGNIVNNAALVYNLKGSQSYSGAISGIGALTKAGPGALTLTGNSSYTGRTRLTSGALVINIPPAAGLYEGLVSSSNGADTTDPIPHTSIQPVARWGASTSNGGSNVFPGWANNTTWGYGGYLDNTSSGSVTYTFGKNFDDAGYLSIDGYAVISDPNWADTVTAQVTLTPGLHTIDLRFGQGGGGVGPNGNAGDNGGPAYGAFGVAYNTTGNTNTTGSWLPMGAGNPDTQFYANVGGAPNTSLVMSSSTSLDLSASSAFGLVALGSLADAPGSPTGHQMLLGGNTLETGIDNSSTTFSGTISGSGGLIKQGSGTFTLAGANTYTGGTAISSGKLNLANPLAVQNSTVNVSSGGALGFAAGIVNPILGGLAGNGSFALATTAFEPVTLDVGNNGQNTTYSGNLSSAGGLTKQGTGILTLTASQSYNGATVINGGTLRLRLSAPVDATAVYTFDNASGSNVPNAANPGTYDGTLQNGAAVTTFPGSPNGYALSLGAQGGNAYLQVAGASNNGIPTSSGTYTASAWFYGLYGPGNWRTLFRGSDANGDNGDHPVIIDTGSNNLGFFGNVAGGGFIGSGYSMASYNGAATWNQLTVVANGGTSTYYIDGQEVGTVPKVSTAGIFAIGDFQGGGQVFSQYIDDVYIYNGTALNAAGVRQLYNATSGGPISNLLPATTVLAIAASSTLDLGGTNQQVVSLSGFSPGNGGSVINSNTGSASVLTLSPGVGSTTFSGIIQGGGSLGTISLVVSGNGTQVLCGSNTYTGGTTINGGTLQLGDGTSGHDGSLATSGIVNNAALVYNLFGNQTANYPISGTGTLTKSGPGKLTVANAISYTGQTLLTGGTLSVTAPPSAGLYEGLVSNTSWNDTNAPIPHSSVQPVARWGTSTNAGGADVFPSWGNYTTWGYSGYLDNTSSGSVTYTFGKNFDDAVFLVIDGVSVINNTVYYQNVTGSITLGPGLHTVDLRFGQINETVGPNGTAGNNGGPAYDAFGLAYNTVRNTATTGTWLQMGASGPNTQFLATNLGGAPSSSVVMSSNTTLDLSASSEFGLVGLGSLADAPGSPTGHQVLLGGNILETGLDKSSTTFSGTISGSGGLSKQGTGTFTLAGTNSYSGPTIVSAGALEAATPASLPGYSTTGSVTVAGGAVLAVQTSNGTAGWSGGQIDSLRASVAWANNTSVLGIDTTNGDFTYGSSITQPLSLTKLGANTLILTGSNTYSGNTTVSGGTLQLGDGTAGHDGSLAGSIVNNAAVVYNLNGNQSYSGVISGAGSLTKAGSGTLTLAGNNISNGKTFLTNGVLVMSAPPPPGLCEGLVSNTNWVDTTDPIPHTTIQPTARWGASTNNGGANVFPSWGNNTTWGYSGYLDNTSSGSVTYTFGKNFDDAAFLLIDGVSVISNTTWNQNVTGSITLGPGLHTVDLRFGQSGGNVGPNTGAYDNYGISYNTVGNAGTGGTWLPMGASGPGTQFYASLAGAPFSSVVMSGNTTLDLSTSNAIGLVAVDSLADAPGSPTGQQVLLGGNTLQTGLDNSSTTFSGTISGSGGLSKQGNGTFTLAGTNTYTGNTGINSGKLNVANPLAVQNSTVNVSSSGALNFAAGIVNPTLGGLAGGGHIALTTAASEPVMLNVGQNGQNTTYSGILSGAGGLTKLGSGVLAVASSNAYAGPTVIRGGTLKLQGLLLGTITTPAFTSDASSGISSSNAYTEALAFKQGGPLSINGVTFANANNTGGAGNLGSIWALTPPLANAWSNAGNFSPGFQPNSTQQTYSLLNNFYYENSGAPVTLTIAGLVPGQSYDARLYYREWIQNDNRLADFTFSNGIIAQNATVNEDADAKGHYIDYPYIAGPNGTLTISESNDTAMLAGGSWLWYGFTNQLIMKTPANLLPTKSALSIAASATLDLGGISQQVASLSDYSPGNGGSIINSNSAASVLTLSPTGGSTTFSGMIQGGGTLGAISLVMSGSGIQVLSSSNTYTGGTAISAGTLELGASDSLPGDTAATVNGTLVFNMFGATISALTGSGTMNHSGSGSNTLAVGSGAFAGTIENSGGTLALLKSGRGQLILSGSDSYLGGTTVTAGTLI
ncbi:MAG: autotransporter-associated beta strand repeat-containing protein, partial [Thermoguttaceae bacterium]